MSQQISAQVLVAPTAIKLHPSPIGMPGEIRMNIIEKLFKGVMIHIYPPPTRFYSRYHTRPLTRLAFAGVDKELREQVYDHVFALKRASVHCGVIGNVLNYPDLADITPLFGQIKELKISHQSLRWWSHDKWFRHGTVRGLLPKPEKLVIEETFNDIGALVGQDGTVVVQPDFAYGILDCQILAMLNMLNNFGFFDPPRTLEFEVVIDIEITIHGVQDCVMSLVDEELRFTKANHFSAEMWMSKWKHPLLSRGG